MKTNDWLIRGISPKKLQREKERALRTARKELDRKMSDRVETILNKAQNTGSLSSLEFSLLMQDVLISKNGYVLDTGSHENVNAEVALRLVKKIKKYPRMWSWFMVG